MVMSESQAVLTISIPQLNKTFDKIKSKKTLYFENEIFPGTLT